MSIERIEPDSRMSMAVTHNGLVYLSGVCGEGPDVKTQTEGMLAEVDRLLAKTGSNKSKILTAQVWLSNMMAIDEMNIVWDAWIDPQNPPARACVEARLTGPEWLVEVMVVAAL